ncbi:phosphatase PAP2 family protein [Methanobacterium oryzae]|uniref:phosphatase PAP2 family protein n=1 Tax=Methanobacterium oryzae TaxID=69540 RepID=UPI003D225E63
MVDRLISALNHVDVSFFYFINLNLQNSVFDVIMPLISDLGYFTLWIVLCVLIYLFGGEKGKDVSIICIIALGFGYFLTEILKYLVERPRPYDVLEGVRILTGVDGSSWPSGHTISSFIGAIILGKNYGYLYVFIAFACLVGFSRIYNGDHYPIDVISGALIGILIALLILRYERNILNLKGKLMQIRKH